MSNRKKRAADGYSNPLAGLGDASALLSGGTYERAAPLTPSLLTALYRESWLAKRIIDMPCEDMTRGWYTLAGALPPQRAEDLRRLEARHEIRREITSAIRWARLYGGACALMVIAGQEDRLDEPLDPDTVMPGSFQGLLVRDRVSGVLPSSELEEDLNDPDFGYPLYYDLQLEASASGPAFLRVHHSRVLRFTGRDLPRGEEIGEMFWGASEILAMGTDQQKSRVLDAIARENALRTSFGLQLLSAGDSLESHPFSFAGLSDVYEAFMLDMAGASGIPATRLFGRSPQGMNATGESDLKTYYELIADMQEKHLRPALEKLLPVMCLSLWGEAPDRLEFTFPPLMTPSPLEQAEILQKQIQALAQARDAGLLTQAEARLRLRDLGVL